MRQVVRLLLPSPFLMWAPSQCWRGMVSDGREGGREGGKEGLERYINNHLFVLFLFINLLLPLLLLLLPQGWVSRSLGSTRGTSAAT